MFTGIISDIGTVKDISRNDGEDTCFVIATAYDTASIDIGASICCSGACMTVIETLDDAFAVEVSDESLSCTTLKDWQQGTRLNLERSLKVGDELGGHFVTGHVDAVAKVLAIKPLEGSHTVAFEIPEGFERYIVAKGSVTINGVALTVNEASNHSFEVNIIPHTWQHTTFSMLKVGDLVNFEIEMLARYVLNR